MPSDSQRDAVLGALNEAHTVQELVEILGGNYHSIYRVVRELAENGLVLEQPFKRDKKNLYVKSTSARAGVIMIHISAGAKPLGAYTGPHMGLNAGSFFKGIVSYLWRWYYHKPPVGEPADPFKWQGELPPIKVKEHLRRLRQYGKDLTTMCDQLLMADVWDDTQGVHHKFGDVADVALILETAKEWEHLVVPREVRGEQTE